MATPLDIVQLASSRAFGSKLITNIHRGLIVEAIVSTALRPDWEWCSEDYYHFDFKHDSGIGLEVKQSAACQSWETKVPSTARWDIAARQQMFENDQYVNRPGRNAAIYALAWHPVVERRLADHRDPAQWEFFVVRSVDLKPTKTMGMSGARRLASPVSIGGLAAAVADALAQHQKEATCDILSSENSN